LAKKRKGTASVLPNTKFLLVAFTIYFNYPSNEETNTNFSPNEERNGQQ
jgi:hypothetical protein